MKLELCNLWFGTLLDFIQDAKLIRPRTEHFMLFEPYIFDSLVCWCSIYNRSREIFTNEEAILRLANKAHQHQHFFFFLLLSPHFT